MAPSAMFETPVGSDEVFKPSQHTLPVTKENYAVTFDPSTHLDYSPPSRIVTMKDLAYEPTVLSDVATTEPFPFLSYEGVLQHRRELFSKPVLDNCMHLTRNGAAYLRGMAPRYSPFLYQFWHSPEVLKLVSDIAGVELVPALDYDICHANIQMGAGGVDEVRNTPVEPPAPSEEAIRQLHESKQNVKEAAGNLDDSKSIVEWHKDSHPWVIVVMLSDARYMEGGETELMKGDGTTIKVRAPQMGHAVILQGRYIPHTALPCSGVMPERVTIVTSFRPKNPLLVDENSCLNTRNKSHLSELYYQWTTYRLEVMAQRARLAAEALKARYEDNVKATDPEGKNGLCRVDTVDVDEVKQWSEDMIKYIQQTMHEMRPLEAHEKGIPDE